MPPFALAALGFLLFLFPGYFISSQLSRGVLSFPWPCRLSLGFACSTAIFGSLSIIASLTAISGPAFVTFVSMVWTALTISITFIKQPPKPPVVWPSKTFFVLVAITTLLCFTQGVPDWDDVFYFSSTAHQSTAERLSDQEPTHQENLPLTKIHSFMSWELLGSVICRLSGVEVIVWYRSVLPLFLPLLYLGSYFSLVLLWVRPRWRSPAVAILGIAFLLGVSDPRHSHSHFFPRVWLAKSVLIHCLLPILAALLWQYTQRPARRLAYLILLCEIAAMATCLSGIFLQFVMVITIALLASPLKRILFFALPSFLVGLGIKFGLSVEDYTLPGWAFYGDWKTLVQNYFAWGSPESLLWLAGIGIVCFGNRRQRKSLVGFSALLFLTWLNPVIHDWVATSLTSYKTYFRLLWLIPSAVGITVGLTELLRGLRATKGKIFSAVAALGLVLLLIPTLSIQCRAWREMRSDYRLSFKESFSHLSKIPGGLRLVVDRLRDDPDILSSRILCDESSALFLAPALPRAHFVQTRPIYTLLYFARAGRVEEGIERVQLAHSLFYPGDEGWADLENYFGQAALKKLKINLPRGQTTPDTLTQLKKYHVGFIVEVPRVHRPESLWALGYRRVISDSGFSLWKTTHPPSTFSPGKK